MEKVSNKNNNLNISTTASKNNVVKLFFSKKATF